MVQEIFQGLFVLTLIGLFTQILSQYRSQEQPLQQQEEEEEEVPPPPRNVIKRQSYKDLPSTPDIKMKLSQKNKKEIVNTDENEPLIKKQVKIPMVESIDLENDEKKEDTEEEVEEDQEDENPKTPVFQITKGSIEYVTSGRINLTASEPTKRKLWDDVDDQK